MSKGDKTATTGRASQAAATTSYMIPAGHAWAGIWKLWAGLGVVGLALAAFGYVRDPHRFAFGYLAAFMFGLTLSLGALFFVLLQYLTGANWSAVVRRGAEQLMGALPVYVVLFLPILLLQKALYPWAGNAAHEPAVVAKSGYLNTGFWLARAVVYFAIWIYFSQKFYSLSRKQDTTGDPKLTLALAGSSAPGMLLFALSLTFAGIDWVMSLEPEWFSTMFGVYLFAGSVVSIYAFLTLLYHRMHAAGLLVREVTNEHFHDIGKMLFAFTVFWAYIAFSQYFLIWYANIPEETRFYLQRQTNGWGTVSIVLVLGHFFFPFLLLLSRHTKRIGPTLTLAALWQLAMHYLDMYWLVIPNAQAEHRYEFKFDWFGDLGSLLLVVGVTMAVTFFRMAQSPIVPVRDPKLDRSLRFENALGCSAYQSRESEICNGARNRRAEEPFHSRNRHR